MDATEVVGRVREKLRTRREPRDVQQIAGFEIRAEPSSTPWLPRSEDAPAALKTVLAQDAQRLNAGTWNLYGWREVHVALPPDWHRDYAGGVDVPSLARHLNHRSLPPGADARTIWEINRWAEMVRLAMHGKVNGDMQAIAKAQQLLADWVEKNPLGRGINWTSALEGGLRLINFCWFDALVQDTIAKSTTSHSTLLEAQKKLANQIVPPHVWWVKRYESFGSSANNHRLGELTGLLLAVRRWPELEHITGSTESLWQAISGCIRSQFARDGGNREQALHYHLFAFEMAVHASRAMEITSGPVMERLSAAAVFFAEVEQSGEAWDYGDSDDAQIVPLPAHRKTAPTEWAAWLHGGSDGEALRYWLGNPSSFQQQSTTSLHTEVTHDNTHWWFTPESGMAVGRHGQWRVRLDASPLGFGKMAAHGHGDALHLSIWDDESALAIDPGTGGYFGAKELRAELAAWEAHNGPQPVGGFKTPRRIGAFLLTQHHAAPELVCDAGAEAPVMRASLNHEGHAFTRRVTFISRGAGDLISVEDTEANGQPFRVRWLLAPECVVSQSPGESAGTASSFTIRRNSGSWRVSLEAVALRVTLDEARASRAYGSEELCSAISVTGSGSMKTIWQRLP